MSDKLKKLQAQLEKQNQELKAKINLEKKRIATENRKKETRLKIIIGAMCLSEMNKSEDFKNRMMRFIDNAQLTERDRQLVNEMLKEQKEQKKPIDDQPTNQHNEISSI